MSIMCLSLANFCVEPSLSSMEFYSTLPVVLSWLHLKDTQKLLMDRQMKQAVTVSGCCALYSAAKQKVFVRGHYVSISSIINTFFSVSMFSIFITVQIKEECPNSSQHFETSSFEEKNNFCHLLSKQPFFTGSNLLIHLTIARVSNAHYCSL